MSRREGEMTIYCKDIVVHGRKGRACVYASENKIQQAIGNHVISPPMSTPVEVRVEVEWSDSKEAKEKQPPWVGSPTFPEWPLKERS